VSRIISADLDDRLAGRFGELVDIGACAGACAQRSDRGDDLAVLDLGDTVDRMNDWDRGLPAAGHHVDVGRIEVGLAIDRRDRVGADCRRREVDHPLARGQNQLAVALVRACRGGVEDDLNIREFRHGKQAVDARRRDRYAQLRRTLEAVRFGIYAHERAHIQYLGQAHHLEHQVGADVARAYDGYPGLRHFTPSRK
jgi:hypothetical protein